MKFEVEVYFGSVCEIVWIDARNRAEAEARAKFIVQPYNKDRITKVKAMPIRAEVSRA